MTRTLKVPHGSGHAETLDEVLRHEFSGIVQTVKPFGHVALRLEAASDGCVIGWVSHLDPQEFLQTLMTLSQQEIPITATVRSSSFGKPDVRLASDELDQEQRDAIYILRADFEDAVVVWERAGRTYSDVAVLSRSWAQAEAYIKHFLPIRARRFLAKHIEDAGQPDTSRE